VSDPATASERAAAFARAHGDALACARADALVGVAPAERALAALAAEDAEGALAPLQRLLGVCDDLGALHAPLVERACVHLARCQRSDGSWRDTPTTGHDAAIPTTGMLAGHLAKTRFARPETLAAAGVFLAAHWSPQRVKGSRWHDLVAYAHAFANIDHEAADEILQWCGRELERGFRTRAFDAVQTARVLVCCDAHSLPGARLDAAELVQALLAEQTDDGSWPATGTAAPADEPPCARVERALDGLVALRRLGGNPLRARAPL
jgi:hypothetical protein